MATNIKSYSNLLDGTWKTSSVNPLEDRNPADCNEIIGLFPMATLDNTKSAVQAAGSAFAAWSRTPAPARGAILDKASQILPPDSMTLQPFSHVKKVNSRRSKRRSDPLRSVCRRGHQ